jgi:hypothetical protein
METVNNHVKELTNEGFYAGWVTPQNQTFLSNDIKELENWSIFMEDISNENENENENDNDNENDKKKKNMKIIKKKIQKPKNAIKRPPSAYLVFCGELRPVIKDENPTMKPQDVIKNLALRWRELQDKSKYIDIALEKKTEYLIVKEQHDQNNNDGDEIVPKVKVPRKSKSVSTRSKSKKAELPILSDENLDQVFVREDDDDVFVTTHIEDVDEDDDIPLCAKSRVKSLKKTTKVSDEDEDDIPLKKEKKISAYTIFCRKNREKIKRQNESSTGRQIVKIINQRWAELSDNKKQKYIDLAASVSST